MARHYTVKTPSRKHTFKQLVKKRYFSAFNTLVHSHIPDEKLIAVFAKKVKRELHHICSLKHNSMLRDTDKGLKCFSWKSVWVELYSNVPNLVKFLRLILRGSPARLICLIVVIILKHRIPKMAIVQGVISTLLYGNGTSKQVC